MIQGASETGLPKIQGQSGLPIECKAKVRYSELQFQKAYTTASIVWEAEAGGFLRVGGQPGLCNVLSQKNKSQLVVAHAFNFSN